MLNNWKSAIIKSLYVCFALKVLSYSRIYSMKFRRKRDNFGRYPAVTDKQSGLSFADKT